jgi:hypothetical protein
MRLLSTALLLTLAAARDFSNDFIDPNTFINGRVVSERSDLTSRTPAAFNKCLYGENTLPLENVQAGMKHLKDLGDTLCVVKYDDLWRRRARFTGVGEGQIYGYNYRQDQADSSSHW